MANILTYVIVGIIIYICIFAIVERICKCKEQCAAFNAYGMYFASIGKKPEDLGLDMEAIMKALKKSTEDK